MAHRLARRRAASRRHRLVVVVEAELAAAARVGDARASRPRVLAAGVEARAGEVETVRVAVRAEHLRLEPGEQAQRLRVALEAADVVRPAASARSPLCPKGGWPRSWARQAVSTTSGSRPRLTASSRPICATSSECVSRLRAKSRPAVGLSTCVFCGEAAQGARVQQPPAVAREVAATVGVLLRQPALGVGLGVAREERGADVPASAATGSSSASVSSARWVSCSSRLSSQRSGRLGTFGVPARPRCPSASAPGYGWSGSSWASRSSICCEAPAGRQGGTQFATDRVALEVPGDVLADVAARPVLLVEELDEQLGVALERAARPRPESARPSRHRR